MSCLLDTLIESYGLLEQAKSPLEDFAIQSIWEEGGPIEGG